MAGTQQSARPGAAGTGPGGGPAASAARVPATAYLNLIVCTVGFALTFWSWNLIAPLATTFVGAVGGLGGFVPPPVMGAIYTAKGTYAIGLMLLSDLAFAGALYAAAQMRRRSG